MSTTKKCPMCAEDIQLEAKVCRFCGARFKLEFQGYCTSCHTKRETDEAGHCPICGNPLMDMHVASTLIGSTSVPKQRPAETAEMVHPQKRGVKRTLLSCLVVLLIIAGGLFTAFFFTGGSELMKPIETVNFDTIQQFQKERRVRIEGSLHLPNSSNCDDNCALELVDYDDPDKVLIIFVDVGAQSEIPEPSHMVRLPYSYKTDSLKVGLNGGGIAGNSASVILTGRICETTGGDICLHVDQIDQGSIPPTPTPTLTPIPTATLRPTATPLPVQVDFANVCAHNGAPVIIRGKIGHLPMFIFCGRTCSLMLVDPGGSGNYIYFEMVRGGSANQMDDLPNKYQESDLKIHTNNGSVVGVGDLVTIQGTVVVYNATSEKDLGCKILLDQIETAP